MTAGDVYTYYPTQHHCREGLAIENDRGVLIDNFWSGDHDPFLTHPVPHDAAGLELKGNLKDYDKLGKYDDINDYAQADRLVVTAQHGLQRTYYVRKGAKPDLTTKIENARRDVEVAGRAVGSAERTLAYAKEKLAELESQQEG
jgi:hypothetical protein